MDMDERLDSAAPESAPREGAASPLETVTLSLLAEDGGDAPADAGVSVFR